MKSATFLFAAGFRIMGLKPSSSWLGIYTCTLQNVIPSDSAAFQCVELTGEARVRLQLQTVAPFLWVSTEIGF